MKQPCKDKDNLPFYNLPHGLFPTLAARTDSSAEDQSLILCVPLASMQGKARFPLLPNTTQRPCATVGFIALQTDTDLPVNL